MKKLREGEVAPDFELERVRGGRFDSRAMKGRKWLLSFHRYAT
jgi:peroxiredoxin